MAAVFVKKLARPEALKIVGRQMSVDEVHQEVVKDVAYYQLSGGGVTLSGGEVMLQPDFAVQVLQNLRREGIHTAVETAGFAPGQRLRKSALWLIWCSMISSWRMTHFINDLPGSVISVFYAILKNY